MVCLDVIPPDFHFSQVQPVPLSPFFFLLGFLFYLQPKNMWWLIMSAMGGYHSSYLDDGEEGDASSMPLDPIDVAGQLKVDRLHSAIRQKPIARFTEQAFSFVTDPSFHDGLYLQRPEGKRNTARKWVPHLEQLALFGILVPILFIDVTLAASYFAVSKGDGTARSIFNGKYLSSNMVPPPPVNLGYLPDLLEKIGSYDKPLSVLTGDIRHWFHQIPLHPAISARHCVGVGGAWWRWSTLPMGISWAPFVAQNMAWSLLLSPFSSADWPFLHSWHDPLLQPPTFLELRGGGFATVYLDNILIVGDPEVLAKMNRKYIGNSHEKGVFAAMGVTLKVWTSLSPKDFAREGNLDFLGVDITRTCKTSSNGKKFYVTRWRQKQKGLANWEERFATALDPRTCTYRSVARVCGRLLWRQSISRLPLCDFAPLMNIIRRLAKQRGTSSWDNRTSLLPEEETTLSEMRDDMLANEWFSMSSKPTDHLDVYACSDSSSTGWGYVIFNHHQPE